MLAHEPVVAHLAQASIGIARRAEAPAPGSAPPAALAAQALHAVPAIRERGALVFRGFAPAGWAFGGEGVNRIEVSLHVLPHNRNTPKLTPLRLRR